LAVLVFPLLVAPFRIIWFVTWFAFWLRCFWYCIDSFGTIKNNC
jgi:hypothetical protein